MGGTFGKEIVMGATDDSERRQAALTLCDRAVSVEEASTFVQMFGLDDLPPKEVTP